MHQTMRFGILLQNYYMKIDTQAMSEPAEGEQCEYKDGYPAMPVPSISVLTPTLREELKELINEVLNERAQRTAYLPNTHFGAVL